MQRAAYDGCEKELERARKDPAFLKAAELAVKAAEIQTMIEAAEEEVAKENIEAKLPEDVMRLRELLGKTTFRQAHEPERYGRSRGLALRRVRRPVR